MESRVWRALVGLVLVAVLPLLIFGGGVAWMIVAQKKSAIEDNLKSTTSALRVALDHELQGQMNQVEVLASDASLDSDNLTAFIGNAKRVIATNGKWINASLVDPRSSKIVATTAAVPTIGPLAGVAASALEEVLKTRDAVIVGALATGAVTKRPFTLLMAPVFRNGQVRYVLSIALDPKAINGLFAEQNLPSTWTGAVIDSHLVLAGRSRAPERYVGVPATPSLAKSITAAQSGLFTAINQEGKTVYTVFDRSTVTGWSVVIGIPAGEVEEPIQRVFKQLAISALVLIAFALGLAWRVGREIVRRQEIESQLTKDIEEKSAQLETIFALSPDGFVSYDAGQRVNYVSPAFSRLSGLSTGSVLGLNEQDFSEKLANACLPTSRFNGIESLKTGAAEDPLSDRLLKNTIVIDAPGNKVLRIAWRKGSSDSVSQILHVRDVTYETEVENLKNQFLATAAHELRTPMASILGFSEVLLHSNFDEDERKEMTAIIHRQSVLIANIINDLLDLARIEARRGDDFVPGTADMHALVTKTVRDFKAPEHRQGPIVAPATGPLPIHVDSDKIQQALTNIISNAYKYSHEGGSVHIGFSTKIEDGHRLVGVSVFDQGIGMNDEQRERVFERFYRADASGKVPGTGLGMNIVKEIVDFHHGRIDLQSAPGQGTTVTIWLPESSNEK